MFVPVLVWSFWETKQAPACWFVSCWSWRAIAGGFLFGAGFFLLGICFVVPLSNALFPFSAAQKSQMLQALNVGQGSRGLGLKWFCFALVPAVCEEMLFRGVVFPFLFQQANPFFSKHTTYQQGLRVWRKAWVGAWLPAAWACMASAFLFALFHLSWSKMIPMFFLGLGLGFVFWRTGVIWASVAMHLLNNALAILVHHSKMEAIFLSASAKMKATVIALVLLGLGGLMFKKKEAGKNQPPVSPPGA